MSMCKSIVNILWHSVHLDQKLTQKSVLLTFRKRDPLHHKQRRAILLNKPCITRVCCVSGAVGAFEPHSSTQCTLPPTSTSHNHATLPQSLSSLAARLQAHSNSLLHRTEIFLFLSRPFPVSLSRNSRRRERREVKNPRQCGREISVWLFFFHSSPKPKMGRLQILLPYQTN